MKLLELLHKARQGLRKLQARFEGWNEHHVRNDFDSQAGKVLGRPITQLRQNLPPFAIYGRSKGQLLEFWEAPGAPILVENGNEENFGNITCLDGKQTTTTDTAVWHRITRADDGTVESIVSIVAQNQPTDSRNVRHQRIANLKYRKKSWKVETHVIGSYTLAKKVKLEGETPSSSAAQSPLPDPQAQAQGAPNVPGDWVLVSVTEHTEGWDYVYSTPTGLQMITVWKTGSSGSGPGGGSAPSGGSGSLSGGGGSSKSAPSGSPSSGSSVPSSGSSGSSTSSAIIPVNGQYIGWFVLEQPSPKFRWTQIIANGETDVLLSYEAGGAPVVSRDESGRLKVRVIRAMALGSPGIAHARLEGDGVYAAATHNVYWILVTLEADPPDEWNAPRWKQFTEAQFNSNRRFWNLARDPEIP